MSEVGSRISTNDQALFYVKQAWYLTRILEKISPSFGPEAMDYRDQIRELETAIKKQVAVQGDLVREESHVPPATPVRNSMQFDFSMVDHPSKAILQRPLSAKIAKNGNFEKAVRGLAHSPSLKNPANPNRITFKKSISFVDPEH